MDIALQLWSIKEEVEANFDDALALVKRAGYNGVEFAGYHGKSPEELKALLEKHGLKAVGTHAGLDRIEEALEEEIRYAKTLGYTLVTCPWLDCTDKAEVERDARRLEACAQKAKAEGIQIAYHNHDQEFKRFDGQYALELLLENAPSVQWEADVFWVAYAGVDPVPYLKEQLPRICAIHAKEIARGGKENVYIGQGAIDFPAVAALCPPERYPFIVEQEEFSSSHEDAVTQSYQGLRRALG